MPDDQARPSAEAVPGPAVKRTASAKSQVAAMLGLRVRASVEAVPGHPAKTLARPFQAAQAAVQARLVFPAVSAAQAAALPPEEPEARDAAVAVVVAAPHEGAAAAEAPHGEEEAAVAALREEAAEAVGAPHEGTGAGAVPHAEAAALAALASQALPLAAAWAFRRDQALPWLVRPPAARSARAPEGWRSASPSERWWQTVRVEVLS
jgi:hypothetical protein